MITYKTMVIPGGERKDGTYPVKIRVTYKGKSRRLPTTLVCQASDLTRSLNIKNPNIIYKADQLINRMREATQRLDPVDIMENDVDWVIAQIKNVFASDSFRLNFFEYADKCMAGMKASSARTYATSVNVFARFLGKRDIDVNAMTRSLITSFIDYVNKSPKVSYCNITGEYKLGTAKKKLHGSTASNYINNLSHIYNQAKKEYNDEDEGRILIKRSPFSNLQQSKVIKQGQRNLGPELIQRIIDSQPKSKQVREALDVFLVSFALMGANIADLYPATPPKNNVWIYNRAKTKDRRADAAEMQVYIPNEIAPLLRRLQTNPEYTEYWLPNLHRIGKTKDSVTQNMNYRLRAWCTGEAIPSFTMYAARHTWASIARSAKVGADKSLIDECLAHVGDFNLVDIYAERDWDRINEVNRKVLALFDWSAIQ